MVRPTALKKATGYDRYIDWKLFSIPLGLFLLILLIPTPDSMLRVGAEYSLGPGYVRDHIAREVFGKDYGELIRWQALLVGIAEVSVDSSSFDRARFLERDHEWCEKKGLSAGEEDLARIRECAGSIPPSGVF